MFHCPIRNMLPFWSGLIACLLALLVVPQALAWESPELRNAAEPPQCYSCEGINCLRTTKQNVTIGCADRLDICVTIYEDFAVSERGCLSQISLEGQAKCQARSPECHKCSGELCNNQGRSDFKCIQCSGSTSSTCNEGAASTLKASQCGLPTSSNSYCYVKVVGENLQRGCATSLKEQKSCLESRDCSLCLPGNSLESVACNTFDLAYAKSSAGLGQRVAGLSLALIGLLALLLFN
ncbi:uncharacterized protein [Drosophila pseudoobscura]|uniref:DUF753 domain-containing protein n=1 Tax=Drosophila pseudoobscura pseudoobscura TaxID=46245 RepID=A0A6I8UWG2_DROPS|nr:uncharacterized protein LOC4805249 [Drosophila pseudoobscura]